jgi:rhodanese-related sulfurtransferase
MVRKWLSRLLPKREADGFWECVENAVNIPHAKLREKLSTLAPDKTTISYCNKGVTGNAVQNLLINRGFKKVLNLSGGHKFYKGTSKID